MSARHMATGTVPPVELQCAIARGWTDDDITRRLGCSAAKVTAARAWLDAVAAEDGPVPRVLTQAEKRQQAERERREHAERRRLARQRFLDDLERERRIVLGNARAAREPERVSARRAYNAAWMRQYRAQQRAAA